MGAGRPTKQTPEIELRLLNALRAGNTRRASCAFAGISDDSLALWMRKSTEFAEAVKSAEAAAEVQSVAIIRQAANESWQAAAWWLERKFAEDWGRKDVLRIERDKILEETRMLAREAGADEDAAVAEVKRMLGVR